MRRQFGEERALNKFEQKKLSLLLKKFFLTKITTGRVSYRGIVAS